MTPAVRISLGIVALTSCLLFAADWLLDIFPDPYAPALKSRQDLSESLAIQYSSLITTNRVSDMQAAMELVVEQIPEVLSMKMQNSADETLAVTDQHAALWSRGKTDRSTPTQVLIPLFSGQEQWGILQVKFEPLPNSGILGIFNTPLYKLVAILSGAGFFAYLLFLSRTLRYLDPGAVVPSRVRSALDQLVEGVFILDHEQRIVLCNSSFASQVAISPDALIGVDPSQLPWVSSTSEGEISDFPWTTAIRQGMRKTEQRLELQSPSNGLRVLTANVSPIVDGGGNQRGVMASFNDITELEKANDGLKDTLNFLESANEDINRKNVELLRLATTDPLTNCFNRRALFEKLEAEFDLACKEQLDLCVLMADIDKFKKINDEFGHAAGDVVIKNMAESLMQAAGTNDSVGRYGGEEFCMVLVGYKIEDAQVLSEKVRTAIKQLRHECDSNPDGIEISASFGLSSIHYGARNVTELLNQADQALYASKNAGRDRVSVWVDVDATLRKAG